MGLNIKGKVTSKERFSALLRALSESRKTGTLIVAHGGVQRRLFFEDGAIVGAASSNVEESFGYLLVEKAIIQDHDLENARKHQREQNVLLGRALVDLNVMSKDEVQHAVQLKVKKTISDILSFPSGKFDLVDERFPDKGSVSMIIDTAELLSTGMEKVEWSKPPKPRTPPTAAPRTPPRPPEPPRPPTHQAVTQDPEPPIREQQPAASDPVLEVIERFQEKHSPTISVEHEKPRYSEVPQKRPVRAAPAPEPRRARGALLVGGAVLGSLALVSIGYWLLREAPSSEMTERAEQLKEPAAHAGEEVLPTAPSQRAPSLPDEASPAERQRDLPPPASAEPAPRKTAAVQTPRSGRPAVATTAKTPPPRAREQETVEKASVAPPQAPTSASVDAGRKPAPAVGQEPSPTPSTREPVVASETPAEPAAGAKDAEPAARAGGETSPAQPEPSGWQSAVFAQKPAVVTVAPSAETQVQTGDLVEPGPDVIDPVVLEVPELSYPKEAKRRKVEAVVRVRVLVDEKGNVVKAELEDSVGYGLDEAALSVAWRTRFIPATKGTVFVKMWTVLPLEYRLEKD